MMSHNNIQFLTTLLDIYEIEQKGNAKPFFSGMKTWEQQLYHYTKISFLTRHIERDTNMAETEKLQKMLDSGEIARDVVWCIAKHSVVDLESTCRKLYGKKAENVIQDIRREAICFESIRIIEALNSLDGVPIEMQMQLFYNGKELFAGYIGLLENAGIDDLNICRQDILDCYDQQNAFVEMVRVVKDIAQKYSCFGEESC